MPPSSSPEGEGGQGVWKQKDSLISNKALICLALLGNREPLNRVPYARTVHRTDSGYPPDFLKSRGFRALRSATKGAALGTRKPFEKGLSENF